MAVVIGDVLAPWVERHGWDPGGDAWARIETLVELWERYGAAMNLHGAKTRDALLRHVQDGLETALCARRATEVSAETRWLDVGSGGGFPALVVAATLPCAVIAVESRQRRASFLDLAFSAIERGSSRVIRGRFDATTWNENVVSGLLDSVGGRISIASSRALFSPAEWLEQGRNVVSARGVVVVHARDRAPEDEHLVCTVSGTLGLIAAYCFT
jgi:16S rRNA (guanine527-N7)-methyltransferase